eukprot:2418660-Prymnesium_polylepis.1
MQQTSRARGGSDLLSRFRLPKHHAGEPVKFEFSLAELTIHLNSTHQAAVCVDDLAVTWRRGQRAATSKPTRVVETLDQATGSLSRTARLLHDLTIPVTLFRTHVGEETRYEPKPSELVMAEAAENDDEQSPHADAGFVSSVRFDLAEHASAEPQIHRGRRGRERERARKGDGGRWR